MGAEDSDIEVGRSFAFVLEILGFDVESCSFLSICASEPEGISLQSTAGEWVSHKRWGIPL